MSQISILKPEVSRVMAAGGAGTWLTFGYEPAGKTADKTAQ